MCLRVDLEELPLEQGVAEVSAELGVTPWQLAAAAGEDYELCFCVAPTRARVEAGRERGKGAVGVTWIGVRGSRDSTRR